MSAIHDRLDRWDVEDAALAAVERRAAASGARPAPPTMADVRDRFVKGLIAASVPGGGGQIADPFGPAFDQFVDRDIAWLLGAAGVR
jgi:hypothetical protein